MVGLSELEQKAAASQALYESYLNRYKQTTAQEGTERPDARVISEARVPSKPSSPNLMLNIAFGAVVGLGLGLVAVIAAELLDSSLTTADDVERRLGRRFLAGIPLLSSLKGMRGLTPISPYNADYHIFHTTKEEEVLRALRTGLNAAGIPVESSKGEASAGQGEINVQYDEAIPAADAHVVVKNAAKEIAWAKGRSLTFMAKPSLRAAGSSCHIHQSLRASPGGSTALRM